MAAVMSRTSTHIAPLGSIVRVSPALVALAALIGLLALSASLAGLFWPAAGSSFSFTTVHGHPVTIFGQGLYRNDSLFSAAAFRGGDIVTLLVALPLLLVATLRYRRGSLRGAFLLVGALTFFLYNGASMAFGAVFNPLFLVYVALFSASLFAFVIAFTAIDRQVLPAYIKPGMPQRALAAFLFIAGPGTALIWISEMLGPLLQGQAPAGLAHYTTLFTHGLDIGVITPAAILAGILLLRREPLGYVLAVPILVMCVLIGLVIIAQTAVQLSVGVPLTTGQLVGIVGGFLAMSALATGMTVAFFRNVADRPLAARA